MCYTGQCPYESGQTLNGSPGECRIGLKEKIPDDGYCVIHDRMLEQSEKLKGTTDDDLALLIDEAWITDDLKKQYYKRITKACFPRV